MVINSYFGTGEVLPPAKDLKFGNLTCLYEKGFIRYIKNGGHEAIRMIYVAVRDKNWLTAEYTIEDEKLEISDDAFKITYQTLFALDDIKFQAAIKIEGKNDNTLSFLMEGEALSAFYKNRIGICIHHPIQECAGQKVEIHQPEGSGYSGFFPESISPHQPFKNIRKIIWCLKSGSRVSIDFEGEVFETEDQRNWTDASYKTYGTPLDLPFPVWVEKGVKLLQHVEVKIDTGKDSLQFSNNNRVLPSTGKKIPFPKIGYSKSTGVQQLSKNEIQLLKEIPFDHYRVEIRLFENWNLKFVSAVSEAQELNVPLEIILFFTDTYEEQIKDFIKRLQLIAPDVKSILALPGNNHVADKTQLENIHQLIKNVFPFIKVGYGTERFFH